jgi:hypothetical protein
MENLREELYRIYLSSPVNLFDEFIALCQSFYEEPVHNLQDMRQRENKKLRGDIFEEFCVLYLKHVKEYDEVYLLKDVPDILLSSFNMVKRDIGIDIICVKKGKYYAVQCKYKKYNKSKKNVITWKILSTFYALCLRTGPWDKYIVMTNCDFVTHNVKKTEKDLSICVGSFRNITKDQWLKMCGKEGQVISNSSNSSNEKEQNLSISNNGDSGKLLNEQKTVKRLDEIRDIRLKRFSI